MSLSMEDVHKLEMIIEGSKECFEDLSEWEQGFVVSMEERFEQYGSETLISDKQWGVLNKIYDVVCQ